MLVEGSEEQFESAASLVIGGRALSSSPELGQMMEGICEGREKVRRMKEEFTPPLVKHSEQMSPRKMVVHLRKPGKGIEDNENKKVFEEGRKKKNPEGVLKKMSNGKTEDNGTSPGYKKMLRDIRETKEREEFLKISLLAKRMRTLSKKKINS